MIRRTFAIVGGVAASLLLASSAMAFECMNASKDQGAGAQALIGPDGELVWATEGLVTRLERGIIDPESGEGFHGLIAFDYDGDGAADASVWIAVGPFGEVPLQAQLNGPACRGVTNLNIYLAECL
jgi:hypothetical protein